MFPEPRLLGNQSRRNSIVYSFIYSCLSVCALPWGHRVKSERSGGACIPVREVTANKQMHPGWWCPCREVQNGEWMKREDVAPSETPQGRHLVVCLSTDPDGVREGMNSVAARKHVAGGGKSNCESSEPRAGLLCGKSKEAARVA